MPVSLVGTEQIAAKPSQFRQRSFKSLRSEVLPLTLLVLCVLLIHGYHPYSEDAAIYVAGIKKMLRPSLYTIDAPFVLSHARLSIFSHLLAGIAFIIRISLDPLLLLTYLSSISVFLYACRQLAVRMFRAEHIRWAATCLAGVCFTLPVAATGLLTMDPYVTARSFSTPFSLLAVIACLDRSWSRALIWLTLTFAMHLQMGVFLAAFLLILVLVDQRRWLFTITACCFGFLIAGFIFLTTIHTTVGAAYQEAVLSRGYFFLATWRWFEVVGLAAPILLLAITAVACGLHTEIGKLSATCVLIGSIACLISICFVHLKGPYFLARVQVLRSFHTIYVIGLVMLGGFLGKFFEGKRTWIGLMLFMIATAGMFLAQRDTYPTSTHIELSELMPTNPWEQAFLWIRRNTPANALFAADSSLLNSPSEDTQGFRALTERSILMDNKDEGVVSLFPALGDIWKQRRDAELHLDELTDAQRIARLRPFGANWLLLSANARTSLPCPFRNATAAVCQMPQ